MSTVTTIPSTDYQEMLEAACDNAVRAAAAVQELFTDYPDAGVDQQSIKDIEHEGDALTAGIVGMLNEGVATPYPADDVYMLAGAIDDIVDHIDHAADLLGLYAVEAPMEQAIEQCAVLHDAARALGRAVLALGEGHDVAALLVEVKAHEDDGDRIVRHAVASLFEHEDVNPRTIIQWKDIFEALEQAIDGCETAAHLVGNIWVKQGKERASAR